MIAVSWLRCSPCLERKAMSNDSTNRRGFLRASVLTAASYGRILGANDRVRVGAVGTGNRCQYLLRLLNEIGTNEIVAVCDVYEPNRMAAKTKNATADAKDYVDHRQVLDRKDID